MLLTKEEILLDILKWTALYKEYDDFASSAYLKNMLPETWEKVNKELPPCVFSLTPPFLYFLKSLSKSIDVKNVLGTTADKELSDFILDYLLNKAKETLLTTEPFKEFEEVFFTYGILAKNFYYYSQLENIIGKEKLTKSISFSTVKDNKLVSTTFESKEEPYVQVITF